MSHCPFHFAVQQIQPLRLCLLTVAVLTLLPGMKGAGAIALNQDQSPGSLELSQQITQALDSRKAEADRLLQQWTPAQQYKLLEQLGIQAAQQIQTNPKARASALKQAAQVRRTAFETGISALQRALEIYQQLNDREGEKEALRSLGNIYFLLAVLGNQDYSYHPVSYPPDFQMQAFLSLIRENLSKAIHYQQQGLAIARELKDPASVEQSLEDLFGNYYTLSLFSYLQKDYLAVINYQQQRLGIARELKQRLNEGEVLGSLGNAYYSLREYSKAIDYQQQSLTIAREQNDLPREENALSGLGSAYHALGAYSKAIDYQQQSLAIARQINVPLETGRSLNELGVALESNGSLPEAERTLLEAVTIWETLREDQSLSQAFQGNGSFATIERDLDKIQALEAQSTTYRSLQRVLVAQNKLTTALEIAERGRARAFVNLLASRIQRQETPSAVIPPISLAEIKQVAKAQNATLVEYSIVDAGSDAFYDINGGQGLLAQPVHEAALYMWVVLPTGVVTFRKVDLNSLKQQNSSIDKMVALSRCLGSVPCELSVTASRGSRGGLEVAQNPTPSDRTGNNRPNQPTQHLYLQQLHKLLIAPIADLLPTDPNAHVIFLPQGSLFLVPFAALQDPQGRYLIEQHTIILAPSIQVLELTHQQRQQMQQTGRQPALVVGNPKMPLQLPPLPAAQKEAEAIAALLHTQALTGAQATKAMVVQQMLKARWIHLATHGILDDQQGLGSAIALAPDGTGEATDGLLTADEILNLKLNAELVVLSACDSGGGRITGDGVIGLARSLITAGVPSVLVSLWAVPDAPTARLMQAFYQQLQSNPDKAQALRQAMLQTRKANPDPQDWAAFILLGEAK